MEAQSRARLAAVALRSLLNAIRVPLYALKLGASYGVRIRLPHALVMQSVFGKSREPALIIQRAAALAFEHAKKLAYFACIYKGIVTAGRVLSVLSGAPPSTPAGAPAALWHAALAAAIGSQFVWARYSHVNYQIVMYLLSRVLIAVVKLLAKRGVAPFSAVTFKQVYPWLAIATWTAVMVLYENDPSVLHPSLAASMNDIYRASNAVAAPESGATTTSTMASAVTAYVPSWATLLVIAHVAYTAGPGAWRTLFSLPQDAEVGSA